MHHRQIRESWLNAHRPNFVNILFLTHRLPYVPNRGDRIRAYYLLREMSRFAEVSLFSLVHDDEEEARANEVPFARRTRIARAGGLAAKARAAAALPGSLPLTHALLHAPDTQASIRALVRESQPDLIVAFCSGVAPLALEPPLASIPFVLDMVDVDSAKWARMAGAAQAPKRWVFAREARTLGAFEAQAVRRARHTLVVNERERDLLMAAVPDARVEVVPNGIECHDFRPPGPPAPSSSVVFCGVMNYAPNVDAVTWFARDIWPAVRQQHPSATFTIVGSSPAREVLALAERDRSIVVTGAVPAVQPHLWNAAVSVAPLRLAQGVQNKVLEALAAGLPVIVTSQVWDGLPACAQRGCVLGRDAESFAEHVAMLLAASPSTRRARAAAAAIETLSWESRLAPLEGLLTGAVERPGPAVALA